MNRHLKIILKKHSGRNFQGKVTVRHQGGRHKRFYRLVDYLRDKRDIVGVVSAIEFDPNRTANLALIIYPDGDKRYILAPIGLQVGDRVTAGKKADIKIGNALPLNKITVGTQVHNVELVPGKGGQIIRSAGTAATITTREDLYVILKMPSGEIRKVPKDCYATVGQLSRPEWKTIQYGKAGRKIHLGIRPTVRGVAQNPDSHPHGGGEGRSGIGMPGPKTPWGKPALGKRTRKKVKYSDSLIIQRRK
jgi:large subunit ribosomal protein L2